MKEVESLFQERSPRLYYVRGFNPPVLIVGKHPDPSAAWVVPAMLPWACARAVRRDQLCDQLMKAHRG